MAKEEEGKKQGSYKRQEEGEDNEENRGKTVEWIVISARLRLRGYQIGWDRKRVFVYDKL